MHTLVVVIQVFGTDEEISNKVIQNVRENGLDIHSSVDVWKRIES